MENNKWLWFCSIPGLYRRERKLLLDYFGEPENIKEASTKEIMMLPFLKSNSKQEIIRFQKKEMLELAEHLQKKHVRFVGCDDTLYPKKLSEISDYPYGLFVKGKLPDNKQRSIAVVGARICTEYGRKMAELIADMLAEHGIAVVSGMAAGIDGYAQHRCLYRGMESFAVIGSGPDICYPKEHIELFAKLEKQGGIISEYPPGTSPHPSHFPQRNRIISGMCDSVIVIEARKKSGSLITADLALEQGRDVYAVPGRFGDPLSEGCNHLIEQGAGIITDRKRLLEELGVENFSKQTEGNDVSACVNMVNLFLGSKKISVEELVGAVKYSRLDVEKALGFLKKKEMAYEVEPGYFVKSESDRNL